MDSKTKKHRNPKRVKCGPGLVIEQHQSKETIIPYFGHLKRHDSLEKQILEARLEGKPVPIIKFSGPRADGLITLGPVWPGPGHGPSLYATKVHTRPDHGLDTTGHGLPRASGLSKRRKGRPTKRWTEDIKEWLQMSPTEAGREAQKREVFRRSVRKATSTQTCQDE
ncbi:hypothetical protein ElyMa_000641200 [Elysia marginata]|uniref:Uncharacterized protein n=1 Tax=Elysia marginata TaxID=1093978 RepID=A0AAV4GCX1_9GAST|nr:hypothetical protein ElyMa_000641200 [Elysia marginata]